MNLIKYLYQQSWQMLLLGMFTAICSGVCAAGLVAVINNGIADSGRLPMFAAAFFGLCLVYLAAKSCSEIVLLNLTQDTIYSLRVQLGHKLLATQPRKLQGMGKPALLAILTKDIETFTQAFQMLPLAIGNGVIVGVCLLYMASLSWQLFFLFAAVLVVCLVGYHLAEQRPLRQLVQVREKLDTVYRHLRGLIDGSKELQLNAARGSQFVDEVLAPSAMEFKQLFVRSIAGYAWLLNVGTILFYIVIGVQLFVIPLWLPQPLETRISMTLILLYLIRPISDLMNILPTLRQAGIALDKIHQLERDLAPVAAGLAEAAPFAGAGPLLLELRGACHHYPGLSDDNPFMLGPLDLSVREGEILFIVGGNGSGKTTLAMLLLGLYEPEQGSIVLNGRAVTDLTRNSYRQYFSAVFADFHLFEQLPGPLSPELCARAEHYIALLEMGHKVTVRDGRFSTTDLSTGQRKRLALVSAYLEDRPVYLFDEWAADQDPVFKHVFYTVLLPELKARGKTVIAITHDDAYFGCADRVVKLQDGKLVPAVQQARPAVAPALALA